MEFEFINKIWLYNNQKGSWNFITLPEVLSSEIKRLFSQTSRGFGSIKVEVDLGLSRWQTLIFPDSKTGCYLLPLKKTILDKNNLAAGQKTSVTIKIKPE